MKLIPISEHPDSAKILYDLLAERVPSVSISHKRMPTWEEHCRFIEVMKPASFDQELREDQYRLSEPRYQGWYLVQEGEDIVGSVYLTKRNEIGVFIFRKEQSLGLGPQAVKLLIEKYGPAKYLANVAPGNEASRKMFEKLGFKTIQHTLALEAE